LAANPIAARPRDKAMIAAAVLRLFDTTNPLVLFELVTLPGEILFLVKSR